MRKLLKIFIHGTTAIMTVGCVVLFADNDLDIYSLWGLLGFLASSYYIENYNDKK